MKRIILAIAVLGTLVACEKKEEINISPDSVPTNHVVITINSINALDSLVITSGSYWFLVRSINNDSPSFFKDNVSANLCCGVYEYSSCGTGCLELKGTEPIYLEYNGDLDVEYK